MSLARSPKFRAALSLATLLWPAVLHAGDDCEIADPELGDVGALTVEWSMGIDDTEPPVLLVYVPDVEGLLLEVELRFTFDGEGETWWLEAIEVDPVSVEAFEVSVPAELFAEAEQAARLGNLVATINAWGIDGSMGAVGAPYLGVAFPWGGDLPVYLDAAGQAVAAPNGVYLESPVASEIGDYTGTVTVEEEY